MTLPQGYLGLGMALGADMVVQTRLDGQMLMITRLVVLLTLVHTFDFWPPCLRVYLFHYLQIHNQPNKHTKPIAIQHGSIHHSDVGDCMSLKTQEAGSSRPRHRYDHNRVGTK